ncbi:MAG: hypothetical protein ACXVAY_00780 [Mucilaginibacter sp.]
MLGVSTSPFNISVLRKTNVWYTVKDGNWSDPSVWQSNGTKKHSYPQPGDDVYICHGITLDIGSIHVRNMYISGSINGTSLATVNITLDGDCQVSGNGLISLQTQAHNFVLNGYNNIIPYSGFNGGSNSTVTYGGIFDQFILNIPYKNLSTTGGQKYQTSDISIAGNFNQQSNYEVGPYNLTVTGSTSLGTVGSYIFSKKSNTGSLLFIGSVDAEGGFDLSVGNPNIEFRGGLIIHTFLFMIGTGNVSFTTNSQTINCGYFSQPWTAPTLIVGALTVTLIGGAQFNLASTLNGTVSDSTLNNSGTLYLAINTTPMTTGIFNYQYTTSSNLGYMFNGNFTLPYTSYANLYIGGTGTKSQSGNTTIGQTLNININGSLPATYECNGYNLTVNGQFNNQGTFKANAYSSILFIGLANWSNGNAGTGIVDLSAGNPDVEFRAGLNIHAVSTITGTGNYKFTTNNQTIDIQINLGGSWNANILISGAITVTFIDGNNNTPNFVYGTLNGDNANSIFINKGVFVYANATAPMATGKLYCNQTTNTFIYGLAGNQDITVPSDTTSGYQNLTLNNSGTKRLLGNVSVKGTYTLISPATLNLNGFSLTNP